jgi:FAD/FMN-containing dehydrogenase
VATALVGFETLAAAVAAASRLGRLASLLALEVVLGPGLELVAAHLGAAPPLRPTPVAALLVELAGDGDPTDELAAVAGELPGVGGAAVATDERERAGLWRWREAHPEAAAALGTVHKADVTVPMSQMVRFLGQVGDAVTGTLPGATWLAYGHLGDGNIHVNVVGPQGSPVAAGDASVDAVLALVLECGGSVSAEHGVGVAKRAWLARQRGADAVAAMAAIKAALDPDRVLNPGVLV